MAIMLQIVSYTADDDGYHAKVQYQGEARLDQSQQQKYDHKKAMIKSLSKNFLYNQNLPIPNQTYRHHHHQPHPLSYKYKYSPTLHAYEDHANNEYHAHAVPKYIQDNPAYNKYLLIEKKAPQTQNILQYQPDILHLYKAKQAIALEK